MGTVSVVGVGKAYKQYAKRWHRVVDWLAKGDEPRHGLHWALRDVSFEVGQGEAVAIIGANGSGKSTLLKVITGTTQSTTGRAIVSGRVAALLELGMGFHPDFTGRENAYMAGQLLGMSRSEIDALMPQIESFAGIGEYIDRPVRIYSSGMHVRLAFSVATARRPELLIVDEALSVGDASFQIRSFDRIREFQKLGTTLLLVSHDLAAVRSICARALWLDKGHVRAYGDTLGVVDAYMAWVYGQRQKIDLPAAPAGPADSAEPAVAQPPEPEEIMPRDVRQDLINSSTLRNDIRVFAFDRDAAKWGNGAIRMTSARLCSSSGETLTWIMGGEKVRVELNAVAYEDKPSVLIGFVVKDRTGQPLFGDNTYLRFMDNPISVRAGEHIRAEFDFRMPVLRGAAYVMAVAVATGTQPDHVVEEWIDEAIRFESHNYQTIQGLVGIPMQDIRVTISTAS